MTHRDHTHAWLLRHSDRLLLTLIALALGVAGATGQATDIAIGSVNATSTPAGTAVDFVANAMIAAVCLPLAALGARGPLRDRPRRPSDIQRTPATARRSRFL
jgi:ABC-type arginine/histidine transport system permease subunit